MDCIREAVLTQPGLTKLFLDMREEPSGGEKDPKGGGDAASSCIGDNVTDDVTEASSRHSKRRRVLGGNSCMHEVLRILKDQSAGGRME